MDATKQVEDGLIVSCQTLEGHLQPNIIAAMARARP